METNKRVKRGVEQKPYKSKFNMVCNIEKKHVHNIMNLILVECGLYVFGYDVISDSFWGKRRDNLHFTIKIKMYDYRASRLKFKVIMDNRNEMKSICEKITDMIRIYYDTFGPELA
jgi:hypothetical protein